jgi:hypothetical protein
VQSITRPASAENVVQAQTPVLARGNCTVVASMATSRKSSKLDVKPVRREPPVGVYPTLGD